MAAWGCEACARARGHTRWGDYGFDTRETYSGRASSSYGYCGLGNHRVNERIEYFAEAKPAAGPPPSPVEAPKGPVGEQLGLF